VISLFCWPLQQLAKKLCQHDNWMEHQLSHLQPTIKEITSLNNAPPLQPKDGKSLDLPKMNYLPNTLVLFNARKWLKTTVTQNCVQRTVNLPIPFVPLTPLLRPSLHKAWKRSVEGENGVPPKGLWQQDTSVYTNSTRSLFAKSQNEDVLFDIQQYDKIL